MFDQWNRYGVRTTLDDPRPQRKLATRMQNVTYTYDETGDTLSILFAPSERATGIELTDHIILRINKAERRAIGMTVLDYSLVAQATEIGPRSFPLTGLSELSVEMRELVIDILRKLSNTAS